MINLTLLQDLSLKWKIKWKTSALWGFFNTSWNIEQKRGHKPFCWLYRSLETSSGSLLDCYCTSGVRVSQRQHGRCKLLLEMYYIFLHSVQDKQFLFCFHQKDKKTLWAMLLPWKANCIFPRSFNMTRIFSYKLKYATFFVGWKKVIFRNYQGEKKKVAHNLLK